MRFVWIFLIVSLSGCQKCNSESQGVTGNTSTNSQSAAAKDSSAIVINNGNASVKIDEVKAGDGEYLENGDSIKVHYVGNVKGTKTPFDSSRKRGQPFQFQLGTPNIIKGWNIGLQGARVGEIRKLTIPPHLGYGERGAGSAIPPNATLEFEIEVVEKVSE